MPTMKRALLVLAALSLTTLSGCAALQNLLKGAFKKPSISFKTARLADASLSDATVNLVYEVNNPNGFGLDLASVDYSFFVEGKQVVAGKPKKGLNLKANGKSELVFPANVKFADIAPVVETFLNKDRAGFKAEGSVGVKTPIGVLNFPLSKEGTFEVPKIPQVSFQAPRIKSVSGTSATIEFPLSIKNRNSFPLPVAGIQGALKVAGADVGTLSTGNLGLLDGSGSKEVTLPLTINLLKVAGAAMALRSGGKAQVSLDGKLTSDAQAVPLNLSQLLNFAK
ncbi:LEA type 2 family protein [Pyxidicoccus xibeiensis]|uniref:LEA type 2 family protein n=1 Tax=Pyxidicoccus xibeiensis TaxID=2906759 RepID=UPI0020A72C1A|nr:LEA type 2 family protein [Pyxidicoccus xibeiensis]MCP3139748.1 LEA type 2 family protein [Pyxidicoccus xibeiensis]